MATKELEVVLTKEETKAISTAEAKDITSPEDMKEAVKILSQLNQTADRLKADKEKLTNPLKELMDEIKGRYSPFEGKLKEAIASWRGKMVTYQTEEKKRADEEAAKIASRVGEGKGKLKPETARKQLKEIDKPENRVSTDVGLVRFKTTPKFEVEDVTKLPKEFILPNEVAIRKAMLNGQKLEGIRYYTEETPINIR